MLPKITAAVNGRKISTDACYVRKDSHAAAQATCGTRKSSCVANIFSSRASPVAKVSSLFSLILLCLLFFGMMITPCNAGSSIHTLTTITQTRQAASFVPFCGSGNVCGGDPTISKVYGVVPKNGQKAVETTLSDTAVPAIQTLVDTVKPLQKTIGEVALKEASSTVGGACTRSGVCTILSQGIPMEGRIGDAENMLPQIAADKTYELMSSDFIPSASTTITAIMVATEVSTDLMEGNFVEATYKGLKIVSKVQIAGIAAMTCGVATAMSPFAPLVHFTSAACGIIASMSFDALVTNTFEQPPLILPSGTEVFSYTSDNALSDGGDQELPSDGGDTSSGGASSGGASSGGASSGGASSGGASSGGASSGGGAPSGSGSSSGAGAPGNNPPNRGFTPPKPILRRTVKSETSDDTDIESTTAEPTTAEPTTAEPTTAEPTTTDGISSKNGAGMVPRNRIPKMGSFGRMHIAASEPSKPVVAEPAPKPVPYGLRFPRMEMQLFTQRQGRHLDQILDREPFLSFYMEESKIRARLGHIIREGRVADGNRLQPSLLQCQLLKRAIDTKVVINMREKTNHRWLDILDSGDSLRDALEIKEHIAADQNKRAVEVIDTMLRRGETHLTLLDGHGRMLYEILRQVQIRDPANINKYTFDVYDLNPNVNLWHDLFFPNSVRVIKGNVLKSETQLEDGMIYFNFCGVMDQIDDIVKYTSSMKVTISGFSPRIRELLANRREIIFSFATRGYKDHTDSGAFRAFVESMLSKPVDDIRAKVVNVRHDFSTYSFFLDPKSGTKRR
jgi:hypothetical protein